ncbi:NAD(P)-dependent oxidoreductase [Novosphingobium sp. Leaf2]|uniref:NAD(P)-dependent oxidoreductase n=1 Tax=Novosphingobium sp. Leaf2 TaxID=1735670 RepID=UPI00138ED617|nr:NAD(P)-dependent oxidoreductase [Novosphingobium sp. Leaf2]
MKSLLKLNGSIHIVADQRTEALAGWISEALTARGVIHRSSVTSSMNGLENLDEAVVLVSLFVPCGSKEMDAMPKLRAIVSPLLGYDWIDLEAASERTIAVVNGEVEENRLGIAEATIMLLLTLLYRLHETERAMRESLATGGIRRNLLQGKTVGIVGSGGIARLVIDRLKPWACHIVVADSYQPADMGVEFVTLDALVADSDAILLLTNLTPQTRHLINADKLATVRPGVIFVNTARGGLIDEGALIDALDDGRVAGAALDVFEQEPLASDHPLRSRSNVILTPHCIGHNEEAKLAVPRVAAENVETLISGDLPGSCRNPAIADRWLATTCG